MSDGGSAGPGWANGLQAHCGRISVGRRHGREAAELALKVFLLGPANIVHTQRWVEALVERGIEVITVTQHVPSGWAPPKGAELLVLPVRNATGYVANTFALKHIVASVRPDVVNAHYASGYGTLAGLAGYKPTVLSVWGSDVFDFPYQSWVGRATDSPATFAGPLGSLPRAM